MPVFLPEEFHRQRNLVGYSPGCLKELDMSGNTCTYIIVIMTVKVFVSMPTL